AQLADDLREFTDRQVPSALGKPAEECVDVVEQSVVLPRGELEEVPQNAGALDVGLNGVEVLLLALSEVLPEVATRVVDVRHRLDARAEDGSAHGESLVVRGGRPQHAIAFDLQLQHHEPDAAVVEVAAPIEGVEAG